MPCGECKWWRQGSRTWRGAIPVPMARCEFPVPVWVLRDYDGIACDDTREDAGTDCPQFTPRAQEAK